MFVLQGRNNYSKKQRMYVTFLYEIDRQNLCILKIDAFINGKAINNNLISLNIWQKIIYKSIQNQSNVDISF